MGGAICFCSLDAKDLLVSPNDTRIIEMRLYQGVI